VTYGEGVASLKQYRTTGKGRSTDEQQNTRIITVRKRAPGKSDAAIHGRKLICKYAPKYNSKISDDNTNAIYFLCKRPDVEV
jgi:hypothetical protein